MFAQAAKSTLRSQLEVDAECECYWFANIEIELAPGDAFRRS